MMAVDAYCAATCRSHDKLVGCIVELNFVHAMTLLASLL